MMPAVTANTALFLDIDGTLLDLARTPDCVKVPRELLRALAGLRFGEQPVLPEGIKTQRGEHQHGRQNHYASPKELWFLRHLPGT